MDKHLKYLMLLLVTTFSLTFTACGSDDDDEPDSPNDISTAGQLNTVTAGVSSKNSYNTSYEDVTVDVGCTAHLFLTADYGNIYVNGGKIVYAGDFNQLSSITTAPLKFENSSATWYNNGGCHIILSNTGTYIRLKAELNADKSAVTFKFQTYKPTNIL